MRAGSFRWRIALWSAVLAGSALVGFSIVSWRLIYGAKVSRLDAKLENQARRLDHPRPRGDWRSLEASLPRELGTDIDTPIAVLIVGAEADVLYQSKGDTTLNLQSLLLPRPVGSLPLPPSDTDRFGRHHDNDPDFHDNDSDDHSGSRFGSPDAPKLLTRRTSRGNWRVALISSPVSQTAIAVSLQAIDQEMAAIRNIFLVAIPSTLLLVAGGAWWLSGRALRPIRQLTTAMQQVTVAGLDQPLPLGKTDREFVELIQVFNQMLERLQRSFNQASRFSGDAAHELKTPLAILQGELEQAMQQATPGSEEQQRWGNLIDEVRRLSGIVRKLLLLSLADAGKMAVYSRAVNLADLMAPLTEDIELWTPHLTVTTDIAPDLWVWGDRDLLTQLLQNLISNAIKYNQPDGWIRLQGRQQAQTIQITISNASSPIPWGARARIFDRFYRSDPARTRQVEGVGLGLSLSREIARAHKGDLVLNEASAAQTAFTLTLPRKE